MPLGDGIRAAERFADIQHRGHRQPVAGVGHCVAVGREPFRVAAEPEHKFAVARAIAVRRRPGPAGEQLQVADGCAVMRREERGHVLDRPGFVHDGRSTL